MEARAKLRFARVGTLKARRVADVVRGKDVNEALKMLAFMNKKPAQMLRKLIQSAVANAEVKQVIDVDTLYIKKLIIDQGPHLHRFMPRAQGRASAIKKKTSHFHIVLDER